MKISYEEFIYTVPEETKKFIEQVLKYLNYYKHEHELLPFDSNFWGSDEIKETIILLYALYHNKEYKQTLLNCEIYSKRFNKLGKTFICSEKSCFEHFKHIFLICENKNLYKYLTPIDLIINNLEKNSCIRSLFFKYSFDDVINILTKKNNEIKKSLIEKDILNMNNDVINYLENATIIKDIIDSEIINYIVYGDKQKLKDKDLVILSLFLSIYFTNSNETNAIKIVLENKGLNLNKILDLYHNKFLAKTSITTQEPNYLTLIENYSTFLDAKITIKNILKKLFNHKINNSHIIENLLDKLNIPSELFDEIEEEIAMELEIQKLNDNIRRILISSNKIYQKLKKEKLENIKNISILLAIFETNNNLVFHLSKNGLTKEKMLTYLKLPQDFLDDIDENKFDYEIFKQKYKNLDDDFLQNLFRKNDIKQIIESLNIDYQKLYTEIFFKSTAELPFDIDERIKSLINSPIDDLDLGNITSIVNYGNSLNFDIKHI